MYVGEAQLAAFAVRAEQAAEAQLSTIYQIPLDRDGEFTRVFAVKLKQLLREPCGGDLEAPRVREKGAGV